MISLKSAMTLSSPVVSTRTGHGVLFSRPKQLRRHLRTASQPRRRRVPLVSSNDEHAWARLNTATVQSNAVPFAKPTGVSLPEKSTNSYQSYVYRHLKAGKEGDRVPLWRAANGAFVKCNRFG
jgi:hypothetical protein